MQAPITAPILIVEDDRKTSQLVSLYLQRDGFRTLAAYAGTEALAMAASQEPLLAILDVLLPDVDGWEVCRRLRESSSVPIVMLSALGQAHDRIRGITLGADDYIVKPFSFQELVVRIKAILRRTRSVSGRSVLSQEGLVVDFEKQRVTVDGSVVALTRSEFRLLWALMDAPGRVFSRAELLLHLYPDGGVVVDRVIDVHIGKLRQKIEHDAAHPHHVLTARGVGYCFADRSSPQEGRS